MFAIMKRKAKFGRKKTNLTTLTHPNVNKQQKYEKYDLATICCHIYILIQCNFDASQC